jgi:FKBP-type peptidyl-prolyl cis-trans isomerase FklB
MHKFFVTVIYLLAAGMVLGNALAQDTPAATTPSAKQTPATAAPAAPAKTQTPAAKKPATGTTAKTATPLTLKTQKEKFSYALGLGSGKRLGESLRKQSVPFDPTLVARGLKDGLAGSKALLTDEEAQAVMQEMQKEMQAKQQEKTKENKKDGEAFLAANKSKEGVVTLPSGLQYKIEKAGTGPRPTATDSVVCNYRGTLIDGTEFDSSYKRGQPATFPVTGVIKGWTEALQLMPVGSKWQLFIPSDLAYGESGNRGIEPNSTLIFEVELMSIEDKSKDKDKAPASDQEKKDQEKKDQPKK